MKIEDLQNWVTGGCVCALIVVRTILLAKYLIMQYEAKYGKSFKRSHNGKVSGVPRKRLKGNQSKSSKRDTHGKAGDH